MDCLGSGSRSLSLGVRTGPASINMVTGCILACQCQRRRISCPTCYSILLGTCCLVSPISPHVSHAPAFQLPYQRLPSPMQSAFVSSLVAITRRWAPGHTAPAFRSVSQQGALEASETTKTSASFADGWPSPAFRFAGSATCLGLGESESSNRWVSLVASLLFPVLPRPLEKGC